MNLMSKVANFPMAQTASRDRPSALLEVVSKVLFRLDFYTCETNNENICFFTFK